MPEDLKEEFMKLAIEEASKSISEKGKIPLFVGAVVVKDGKVLARAHRGEISQGDHAEYTVLERKLADTDLSGATLYTTLEPCTTRNHPKVPCAKRIVQRRLARVVIGILDPNPAIRGKGVWILTENKVEVEHFPHPLQEEIRKLNQAFIDEQLSKKDEKLTTEIQKEKIEMNQNVNVADNNGLKIIQAGRDVIINPPPPPTTTEQILRKESDSGIVLLFDLVGHSRQSEELGGTICGEALNIFFSTLKEISPAEFKWVKDSGDACLFIGNDPQKAVNFYQEARKQFPPDGKEVYCYRGFEIKFRLVAHFCPFTVKYNPNDQITDISGDGINFLFKKVEKAATAGQMVVSQDFYKHYHSDLESEGFGFAPFTAEDRATELYLLVLPVLPKEIISSQPNTKLLFDRINELKKDVQKIKTLGGIYPDLDMASQFIKLRLDTTAAQEEPIKDEERDIYSFQYESKRSSKTDHRQLLECDNIYDDYPLLLIKGIPGVGKTTILKYFCFKAFNEDKYALFIPCLELPNISQWKREYPYTSEDNITLFMAHLLTFAFVYPNKTYNEISQAQKQNFAEMVNLVKEWINDKKILFCLDALDEVTDITQQKEILRLVIKWFDSIKDGKVYHIYLTGRNHIFTELSDGVPLASVHPLVLSQFQDLGEKFLKDKTRLLSRFREESWKQEVVVSVASTPLLATLVLVYFENKGEFGRRATILRTITFFILLRIWDRLKNPDYQKQVSIEELFKTVSHPGTIEQNQELSLLVNALEELVWNALFGYEKGYVSKFEEKTVIAIFDKLFIPKAPEHITASELLADLQKGCFLLKIATAPNYYTFIHLSILEFLATRRMERLETNEFLDKFREFISNKGLFPLEVLPLFSAFSFENLNKTISGLEAYPNHPNPLFKDGMAFRILVEAEGFLREQTDDYRNRLIINQHQSLLDRFKALKAKFLNQLVSYFETNDLNLLKECSKVFNATSRFQDMELLERLNYSLFEGEDDMVKARDGLLEQMVHSRLILDWKTSQRNLRQKPEEIRPIKWENILALNSKKYLLDDKNFDYYSKLIPELKGFFGSPNLKHSAEVNNAVFSPDGKYILSASWDSTLKLWEAETGKEVRTFKGHSDRVKSGVFSPDGKYILSASWDNTLKLWEAETGKEVRTFKGHSNWVNSGVFSPDGQYILSASDDNTLKLWNTATGKEVRTFKGHSSFVECGVFSPDGKYILSASRDETLKLWEAETGKEVRTFDGHSFGVKSGVFSPDGQYILSASLDNTLKLWKAETGEEVRTFNGHSTYVNSGVFSPDGKYILSASGDKTLKLWEAETGKEVRTFMGHSDGVLSGVFSPDVQYILSASWDKTLKLWEAETGKEVRTFNGHLNWVYSGVFSPDGKYILSASSDNTLKLWEAETGTCLKTIELVWVANRIAIHPKERGTILTANANCTLSLFRVKELEGEGIGAICHGERRPELIRENPSTS